MFVGKYYLNKQLALCCATFVVFIQAFAVVRFLTLLYMSYILGFYSVLVLN